jgi:protein disulfide-isomerase
MLISHHGFIYQHRLGESQLKLFTMPLRHTLFFALLAIASTIAAAPLPYDEKANATAEVEQALAQAAAIQKPVLLIFGANWCGDCRALDAALKNNKNASLIE